jgi:hypothetical protein
MLQLDMLPPEALFEHVVAGIEYLAASSEFGMTHPGAAQAHGRQKCLNVQIFVKILSAVGNSG